MSLCHNFNLFLHALYYDPQMDWTQVESQGLIYRRTNCFVAGGVSGHYSVTCSSLVLFVLLKWINVSIAEAEAISQDREAWLGIVNQCTNLSC